jgi:hypothetical protein
MTEAEVFQLERKRSGITTEGDYLYIITKKTASFISACCRIGGLLGATAPEQIDALTQYGLDIGVAFQISDDALDFVADQERFGKAIGADLREGKRTLPLIAMLERVTPEEAERVRGLLARRSLDPREVEDIRRLVVEHDGVEYALRPWPRLGVRRGGQGRPQGVPALRRARDPRPGGRVRRRPRPLTPPRDRGPGGRPCYVGPSMGSRPVRERVRRP